MTGNGELGAYRLITVVDGAASPQPGQFYMLGAAERWGGGEGKRPFLPRAFSVLRARGSELHFLIEDVGPGTKRLCELEPAEFNAQCPAPANAMALVSLSAWRIGPSRHSRT